MSQVGRYSGRDTGGNPGFPADVRNGRVPLAILRRCHSQAHLPGPAGYLYPSAAEGFDRMTDAARRNGIALRLVVGYRPYSEQQRMKRYWTARGQPGNAAVPGTSSHGWGTAADVRISAGVKAWLRDNAPRYGWDHPRWADDGVGSEEDWHWQYIRGWEPEAEMEEIPVAVLIPGSEGRLIDGNGYDKARVIAARFGARIAGVGPDYVDFERGDRKARVPARIEGGVGWVRLDALTGIGIEADWRQAVVLREA